MKSQNLSHKDQCYFIDGYVYNCPFCNRRNVSYGIASQGEFNWDASRPAYFYIVTCSESECRRRSFHLSYYPLTLDYNCNHFIFPPKQEVKTAGTRGLTVTSSAPILDENNNPIMKLDDVFFYHQPTSFFTVDERIPRVIREAITEADNCRNNNFLTGASACLRKAIYKLLQSQKIPEVDKASNFLKYNVRIDLLSEKLTGIDSDYINSLKAIQALTSQELHENDWKDLDGPKITFLLMVLNEILFAIFVLPDEQKNKAAKIAGLKAVAFKRPVN